MALNSSDKQTKNTQRTSQIFFEYGDFIRSIIHTKINDWEKEEEMLQDFYLSLVHKPIPPDVQNIKSYLYRAIINDITDSRRRSERYMKYIKKFEKKMKLSINKSTPENAYINEEQISKMLKLIKEQLPVSCSKAITLYYIENMSIQEIAEKMNVKTASVSRYISSGVKRLRRLWKRKRGNYHGYVL
jgi:RNA polymerase sigma-70 factor (ECF subfamily)